MGLTQKDLDAGVANRLPERQLRTIWKEVELNRLLDIVREGLEMDYHTKYPEGEYALYDSVTVFKKTDPDDINKTIEEVSYTYLDEYLEQSLDMDNPGEDNQTVKLNREIQSLIDNGKIAPTIELFIETELAKRVDTTIEDNEYLIKVDESKYFEFIKPVLLDIVSEASDLKVQEFKNNLAEKVITVGQEERYKIKVESAKEAVKSNDYTLFEAEASINGVEPKDLAEYIIVIGDQWFNSVKTITASVEALRIGVSKKIEGSVKTYEDLDALSELYRDLKEASTPEDIAGLITKLSK